MSAACTALHGFASALPIHRFPFVPNSISRNGIYLLFERSETAHGGRRIVRVGTHTGNDQLRKRLAQHFLKESKDRSIFQKNIGRAILHQAEDPFLDHWNLDLTTKAARLRYAGEIDAIYQQKIERAVSAYVRANFSFCVLDVAEKSERLALESRIISTLSMCEECEPSLGWLGRASPIPKILRYGLWQVNELHKTSLSEAEVAALAARYAETSHE
jgi:hypothetical protein